MFSGEFSYFKGFKKINLKQLMLKFSFFSLFVHIKTKTGNISEVKNTEITSLSRIIQKCLVRKETHHKLIIIFICVKIEIG